MDLNLKGRPALVTGSTAGIGLAIATRSLAREGARVRGNERMIDLESALEISPLRKGEVFLGARRHIMNGKSTPVFIENASAPAATSFCKRLQGRPRRPILLVTCRHKP